MFDGVHAYLVQFQAVLEKLPDQHALRFDGSLLLEDEERSQEKREQKGKMYSVTLEQRGR